MTWLSVTELEAGYGKRQVLFGASIELQEGEVALVVGPNGSGKSTLLRAIFQQCDVYSAKEFCFDDRELWNEPVHVLIKLGLAYTPQYKNVFDRLTVRENLALTLATRNIQAVTDSLEQVLHDIPDLVPMLGKVAGQLSGGQRQLLALSMGLSSRPKLLLLDEPLAGLDERSIGRVAAIVEQYRHHYGVSFVIVEHRFTKLTDLADKCYGMKLGKTVVTLDTPQLHDSRQFGAAMQEVFFA